MKPLVTLTALLFSLTLSAKVTVKALGVASILIEDGSTQVLFDAPFTRPGLLHWLGIKKLRSNKDLVESVIKKRQLESLDGVFISHSHFDHSVDAPTMAALTGATLFADKNLQRIASAYNNSNITIESIYSGKKIEIGDFVITPIEIKHEKTLGINFLPGNVPEDFNFDFYDYKAGNTWMFLVEHSKGVILIEEAEKMNLKELQQFRPDITHIDVLIQGVSRNKKKELLNGYLSHLKPEVFIPNHFDNFFLSYDPDKFRLMPMSSFAQTLEWLKTKTPSTKIINPKLGKPITVF